eukprot:TRINITY_DN11349_c0_g1_i1.p1 TRINITY_DN11349_c0_g1~~TRINITY_DN11349_c0_g1_i1.p1  ORF type:complete len:269 (-),score=82.04 TRINITY_DN11349_c0_g1_i1:32-838(-)
MESTTVLVSNIVPTETPSTAASLSNFFSYCGEIDGLQISEIKEDGTVEAIVTFKNRSSLNTALVLNGTRMQDKKISIEVAPEGVHAISMVEQPPILDDNGDDVLQSNESGVPEPVTQTSVVASLLAAGYDLKNDALQKAVQFDEEHGLLDSIKQASASVTQSVDEFDEKFQISNKFDQIGQDVTNTINSVDEQFEISQRASAFGERASAFFGAAFESISTTVSEGATEAEHFISTNETLTTSINAVQEFGSSVGEKASNLVTQATESN